MTESPMAAKAAMFLATLALSSASALAAPIASAPLPTPLVVDSTGKVIGRAMGDNNVLVDINGEVVGFHLMHTDRYFDGAWVTRAAPGLYWSHDLANGEVEQLAYFTKSGCKGTAYLVPSDPTKMPGTRLFGQAFTLNALPGSPYYGYVADQAAMVSDITFGYVWNGNFCNGVSTFASRAYAVKEVISLDALGTMPFFVK